MIRAAEASCLAAASSPESSHAIPRVLVTSHKLGMDEMPLGLRANIAAWAWNNPGFKCLYMNDTEMDSFVRTQCRIPGCSSAYAKLRSGAARADLFRNVYLYERGGWWHDADLRPVRLADCHGIEPTDRLALFEYKDSKRNHGIRYTLLAASKAHPLLRLNIQRIVANIHAFNKTSESAKACGASSCNRALALTGPITLWKTLKAAVPGFTLARPGSEWHLKEEGGQLRYTTCGFSRSSYGAYRSDMRSMGTKHHYTSDALARLRLR